MKWDSKSLWLKAKVYIDRANEFGHGEEFATWCTLSLELLARSALTKIHPVLNADPTSDLNLLYAFGYNISAQPRSLPAHAVFLRLEKIIPKFGKVQRELCDYLALLRNEEIHTGELAFKSLKESQWLPRFYEVCKILCESLDKSLTEFVGSEVGDKALKLIKTLNKDIENTVKSKIAAHAKVFKAKSKKKRAQLVQTAVSRTKLLPLGRTSHPCPSCGTAGILRGDLMKESKPKYEDEMLTIDQDFLAVEFTCIACGLELHSAQELAYSDIEPRFPQQRTTDLHELFQPEYYDDYANM